MAYTITPTSWRYGFVTDADSIGFVTRYGGVLSGHLTVPAPRDGGYANWVGDYTSFDRALTAVRLAHRMRSRYPWTRPQQSREGRDAEMRR